MFSPATFIPSSILLIMKSVTHPDQRFLILIHKDLRQSNRFYHAHHRVLAAYKSLHRCACLSAALLATPLLAHASALMLARKPFSTSELVAGGSST